MGWGGADGMGRGGNRWDGAGRAGGERCGRGRGPPSTWPPAAHARSYPHPDPVESNNLSLTPVKPVTASGSHKPGQTQEYQNVSLLEKRTVPNTPGRRLRSPSAANSSSIPWPIQAWFPPGLPEGCSRRVTAAQVPLTESGRQAVMNS